MTETTHDLPRVLFIEQFAVGGLIHYAHSLCHALAQQGVEVSLLTSSDYELADLPRAFRLLDHLSLWNPYTLQGARRHGIARRLEQFGKGVRYLWSLWISLLTIWREQPDIVHTSEMKFPIDLMLFLLPRHFRIVHTCHNVQRFAEAEGDIVRTNRLWYNAQRWMYQRCDGVIFHAAQSAAEFRTVFEFEPTHWTIIPHGEYDLFAPEEAVPMAEARRTLGLDREGRLVLFFGALRQYKGLDILMEAMAQLRKSIPDGRLVIAGAPLRDVDVQSLHVQAQRLELEDSIAWHVGYVPHEAVHLYFYACDVIALPYLRVYESGVLKIAQALGRPVVVTRTGGLPQAVEGGRAGLLVPPSDPDHLADALITLLTNPTLAHQLAKRGQELADTEFGWRAVAEQTKQFYEKVIGLACAS